MAKVANNVLSDDQIAAELTALGCPFTTDLLQKFVTALSVHTHQGSVPRGIETGADGNEINQVDNITKQPLLVDNPYDEAEVARKRKLRSAVERKLNLAYGANAYVAFDGAPAPAPAAPAAAAPAPAQPAQPAPNAPAAATGK